MKSDGIGFHSIQYLLLVVIIMCLFLDLHTICGNFLIPLCLSMTFHSMMLVNQEMQLVGNILP